MIQMINDTSIGQRKSLKDFYKTYMQMKPRSISKEFHQLKTHYSLWKATKRLKRPIKPVPPIRDQHGNWARTNIEKATIFAELFVNVFQPYPFDDAEQERNITQFINAPYQMSLPIKHFKTTEVSYAIKQINLHKAPGYDLITGIVLRNLPKRALALVTSIFNAIIRIGHFPSQWKYSQIIVLPKPCKPTSEVSS